MRTTAARAGLTAALVGAGALTAGGVPGQDPSRDIEVIARRFTFEPSRIEVTLGERVRLLVVSADGVHGLEIKKFNVNREIPRDAAPVTIEFTASEVGVFPILCSEYCGDGHDDMKGQLVVLTRESQAREGKLE